MSVRVSRKLLEAALAGLNEADGEFEAEKDYDGLAAKLSNAPDGASWSTPGIEGMGDGFVKRNGMWYVSTELTSEQLAQILAPSGEEKLARADEKGSTDLSLSATDFVVGVGKGVNFVREEPGGVWRDNTPIESKMLAAYKFKEQMGEVMPTREGTLRMVKDDKFMFLLDQSSLEFYIMDVNNNPNDPLASMKRLFDNATVNGKFGISDQDVIEAKKIANLAGGESPPTLEKDGDKDAYKGKLAAYNAKFGTNLDEIQDYAKSFKRIVPFVDEPKAFKFNTNFFRGGKIEDAMNSARTIFGAFFDLFTPGTDLEMEFKFTQWGPAFARRTQTFRRLMGKKTSMSDSDFAKFAETDYFEVVTMPNASGEYTLSMTEPRKVTVSSDTFPNVIGGVTPVLDVKAEDNTYGWAYVLYLLGILTREAEQSAVTPVRPEPAPPAPPRGTSTPEIPQDVLSRVGKPLGKPEGAFYFDFAQTVPIDPGGYEDSVVKDFTDLYNTIPPAYWQRPDRKNLSIVFLGTADPIDTDLKNDALSKERAINVYERVKEKIRNLSGATSWWWPLGENPWKSNESTYENIKDNEKRKPLRFAKAYLALSTVAPKDGKSDLLEPKSTQVIGLAKEFGDAAMKKADPSLIIKESIRKEVQRILREINGK